MGKLFKRLIATILVVLICLTSAPLQGFVGLEWPDINLPSIGDWFGSKASAADSNEMKVGDLFYFGSYPQKKITDTNTILKLDSLNKNWKSFGYYNVDMKYADILLDDQKYRAIIFSNYRTRGQQTNNNYYINNIYYFKYEPVLWQVLDPKEGLVTTKYVIDGQPFFDGEYYYVSDVSGMGTSYSDSNHIYYCNNYARSTVRKWLNTDFYSTVFNDYEKTKIRMRYISNKAWNNSTKYSCENTKDNVFLLSQEEISNASYGFGDKSKTQTTSTDYAKSQGSVTYFNGATILLRTAGSLSHWVGAMFNGGGASNQDRFDSTLGIRPAIYMDFSEDFHIDDSNTDLYVGLSNDYTLSENDISLFYESTAENISNFDIKKLKLNVSDKSILEVEDIRTFKYYKEKIHFYAETKTKKLGKTQITVTYAGSEVASFNVTVKKPTELKFEIEDPDFKYFEADGVFFDSCGNLTEDGVSLKMKYSNKMLEELSYYIEDVEIRKQLTINDAKILFEIEEGAGLSFHNTNNEKIKEITIENLELFQTTEDELKIFCTDSNALGQYNAVNAKIKYTVFINEDGNYVEKASDYLEFEVQSYKRHYINEHATALTDEDRFQKVMISSFAKRMIGIEDSFDFKYTQLLNDSLLKNLVDATSDLDEIKSYHIFIADLISKMNGDVTGSVNTAFGEKTLNTCEKILDLFNEIADDLLFDGEMRKVVSQLCPEAILNHIMGLERLNKLDELTETALKNAYFRRKFLDIFGGTETVNKICKAGGIALNTFKDIQNVMLVNDALSSVEQMLEEQKDVLEALSDNAKAQGNYALSTALSAYTTYTPEVSDTLIKTCVDTILLANPDTIFSAVSLFAGKMVKEAVQENITTVLGEKVFSGVMVGFETVMLSFECGRLLSDLLCGNSGYADACLNLVLGGHMAESLFEEILEFHRLMLSETDLDKAFEYAKSLDYAMNMYKKLEIMACDSIADAMKSRALSSAVQIFCKEKEEDYKEVIAEAMARKATISVAYCHDFGLENIYAEAVGLEKPELEDMLNSSANREVLYKTLCVQCPVDVVVRNKDGEIVASVENNVVTKQSETVQIVVFEAEKFITLPASDEYDVDITATDAGTMDYTVIEYDSRSGENVRSVSYEAVPLVKDKEFAANVNTEKFTDKNNYNLSAGSEILEATSDDYVPVTEISLDNNKNTLYINETVTLDIMVLPENASTVSYTWSSSDESVVTVVGGEIKGLKEGTATITCEVSDNSNIKDTFVVTVTSCAHTYSEWETVTESTCSKYGFMRRECSVCNTSELKQLTTLASHVPESESYYKAPTCTKNAANIVFCQNCTEVCSSVEIPNTATGHNLSDEITIDKPATELSSGSSSRHCLNCGEKTDVTKIPAISSIALSQTTYVYDGKKHTPTPVVKDSSGKTLVLNQDYTIAIEGNGINSGTYVVKFTFIGKYSGSAERTYRIGPSKTKNLRVSTYTIDSVTLSWDAISGATGYRIYKYNPSTGTYPTIGYIPGETSYKVKNLSLGTQYKFKVRAYLNTDNGPVWGEYSDILTTSTKPGQTTGLKATDYSTTSVTLSWKAVPGATGYRIYKYDPSTGKYPTVGYVPGKTNFTVKDLATGTQYKFKVRAYINTDNGAVWGEYTDVLSTSTRPGQTTNLKTTGQTTTSITLSWKAVPGASGYRIYKYDPSTGKYPTVGYVPGKTSFTVNKLAGSTQYKFKVRAYINTDNGAVWGEYTNVLTASTK